MNKKQRKQHKKAKHTKKENILLYVGAGCLVLALGVSVVILGALYARQRSSAFNWPTSQNTAIVITSNQFRVTVNKVSRSYVSLPGSSLPATDAYVIIDLSITNKTDKPQPFYPDQQTYIRGDAVDSFNMSPVLLTAPLQAGMLLPNHTISGQLSYEVPKNLLYPKLYVDLGWGNTTPVVFNLTY